MLKIDREKHLENFQSIADQGDEPDEEDRHEVDVRSHDRTQETTDMTKSEVQMDQSQNEMWSEGGKVWDIRYFASQFHVRRRISLTVTR
jgi:hypothetical protein